MSYPVYHSIHDSYHWITSFVDPHFTHHLALGRIWAKLTMALADQQILPFNLSRLAWQLSQCQRSLLAKHGKGFEQHGISPSKSCLHFTCPLIEVLPFHARRHVRSYLPVSTHVQYPQHKGKFTRTNNVILAYCKQTDYYCYYYHYQLCNRTYQIETLLSQLQH